MKKIFIILPLFLFLSPREAQVSQIHFREISLREMIEKSGSILHVRKIEPFTVTENIPIHENVKKYPPFIKLTYHFEVIDDLLNGRSGLKGKRITVRPAHFRRSLELHKAYHLEGTSKSPIYWRYRSSLNFDETRELILFLRAEEGLYEMTVSGAYESIRKKRKIRRLLSKMERQGHRRKILPEN